MAIDDATPAKCSISNCEHCRCPAKFAPLRLPLPNCRQLDDLELAPPEFFDGMMDPSTKRKLPEYELANEKKTKKKYGLHSSHYHDPRRQVTLSTWVQKSAGAGRLIELPQDAQEATADNAMGVPPGCLPLDTQKETTLGEMKPIAQTEKNAKMIEAWTGDNYETMQVEDITHAGDVYRVCARAENGEIIISDESYMAIDGLSKEQIQLFSANAENDVITSPAEGTRGYQDERLDVESILRAVEGSFGSGWAEILDFLCTPSAVTDEESFSAQFESFRTCEAALSGWDPAHIVKPSGSPNSALHLMLNYPTFKTQKPDFGETADDTNVCTNLLLKKGLSADNSFWYEACFRRQEPPTVRHQATATKFWPSEIRDLHTSISLVCERLPKKVLLLFGAPNRKDFEARHTVSGCHVRVSDNEQVTVAPVRDQDGTISFMVVYCTHPEWLFHNWSEWASRYFDACVNVAAALANVNINPVYFQRRAQALLWKVRDDTPSKDAQTALYLEKANGVLCPPSELPKSVLAFLYQHSVNFNDLATEYNEERSVVLYAYKLIQKANPQIKALRRVKMDKELVLKRQQWFESLPDDAYGQNSKAIAMLAQSDDAFPDNQILSRGTLFQDNTRTYLYRPTHATVGSADPLSCSRTTESSLQLGGPPDSTVQLTDPANRSAISAAPPLQISTSINIGPNEIPSSSKSKNPLINTAVIRLGTPVNLKCIKCGMPPARSPINTRPEFCTIAHVAGRYIARAQVCETPDCQDGWKKEKGRSGRRMMMIPQDTSIPFVRSDQLNEMNY